MKHFFLKLIIAASLVATSQAAFAGKDVYYMSSSACMVQPAELKELLNYNTENLNTPNSIAYTCPFVTHPISPAVGALLIVRGYDRNPGRNQDITCYLDATDAYGLSYGSSSGRTNGASPDGQRFKVRLSNMDPLVDKYFSVTCFIPPTVAPDGGPVHSNITSLTLEVSY